jgi:hypothetical protein
MSCPGVHCKGCGSGKGSAAVLVITVISAYAIYRTLTSRTVEHAASELLTALAVAAYTVAGLAVTAGLTTAGLTVRRGLVVRRAARIAREPVTLIRARTIPAMTTPPRLRALPGPEPVRPAHARLGRVLSRAVIVGRGDVS